MNRSEWTQEVFIWADTCFESIILEDCAKYIRTLYKREVEEASEVFGLLERALNTFSVDPDEENGPLVEMLYNKGFQLARWYELDEQLSAMTDVEQPIAKAVVPANAAFAVVWFCSSMEEKEERVGDLRQNFVQDLRLTGSEKKARLLAYRYAYRVAAPALGEWLRRKVVQRVLGSAVAWLNRKIN